MSTKTGWCLTGDCDSADTRGGCPVKTASNPACPCPCPCPQGAVQPRTFLEERTRVPRKPAGE